MNDTLRQTYLDPLLASVPRVLSMMDREVLSPTAGCCDRTFWAWKFVDFPRSRFQEALCFLSFVYATDLPQTGLHRNSHLHAWIANGFRYWSTLQHSDGSFDEAYPLERSFAATAFTTFYVAEAEALIGEALPGEIHELLRSTIARAGRWLLANDETHGFLSNHQAAGAAALYHAFRISGDSEFRQGSRRLWRRILDRQSSEGWYEEYGGADPGYQTHGSFYLARLWQLSREEEILASLSRSMIFLAHFVHPDASLGGEYASRNTQTYYPAAFEMLAATDATAAWIAEALRPSVATGSAAGLATVDRYNLFPMLNNLVFAYSAATQEAQGRVEPRDPAGETRLAWFPQAGMARVRTDHLDAFIGVTKGGVVKAFDRRLGRLIYNDCGYVGRLDNGHLISTQQQDGSSPVRVEPERIAIEGRFFEVSRPTMSPARFLAFRLVSLTAGRVPGLARWLKNQLVRVLIYRKRELDIRFLRTIEIDGPRLRVRDTLRGAGGTSVETLTWQEVFTTIHMGSARHYIRNEALELPVGNSEKLNPNQLASGIEVVREIQAE
jgi:hypothetical protein